MNGTPVIMSMAATSVHVMMEKVEVEVQVEVQVEAVEVVTTVMVNTCLHVHNIE